MEYMVDCAVCKWEGWGGRCNADCLDKVFTVKFERLVEDGECPNFLARVCDIEGCDCGYLTTEEYEDYRRRTK